MQWLSEYLFFLYMKEIMIVLLNDDNPWPVLKVETLLLDRINLLSEIYGM